MSRCQRGMIRLDRHPTTIRNARRSRVTPRASRLAIGLAIGLTTGLTLRTAAASADPCWIEAPDSTPLRDTLAAASRTRPAPSATARSRLGALLPKSVRLSLRDGTAEGMGWYLAATGDLPSERGLLSRQRGVQVSLAWDLAPLWRPAAPPPRVDALKRLERLEALAEKLGRQLERLGKARAAAQMLSEDDPACGLHRARAAAARFVLDAVTARSAAVANTSGYGSQLGASLP